MFNSLNKESVKHFGEVVTCERGNFSAIFDTFVADGKLAKQEQNYCVNLLFAVQNECPNLQPKDKLIVNGETYTFVKKIPDGGGMVKIILNDNPETAEWYEDDSEQ